VRVLDLFSGIGGFSLGLERAGMRTVAFCEIEPYCRAVLAKHWPGVPCFPDIRGIDSYELGRLGGIDVICGGFPCQDISLAGNGAGLAGERSGLWSEYARVIGLVRPAYVIVENVAALLGRGLGTVLSDLAAIGYDAEWHCIPASAVGAPHRRDRIWIIAYPGGNEHESACIEKRWTTAAGFSEAASYPHGKGQHDGTVDAEMGSASESVADSARLQSGRQEQRTKRKRARTRSESADVADAAITGLQGTAPFCELERGRFAINGESLNGNAWELEPDVGRVAHGVPARVDRLRALGNAVVPQIPEIIGRAIMRQNDA
jgi:DNA (cytosine-5)-methyltransferase 1